jgi:hypothetical protein
MDNDHQISSDKRVEPGGDTTSSGETTATRRKFNRNAAVGSAVLLTLGNRVAWGTEQVVTDQECVSAATFASLGNASVGAAHASEIADFKNFNYDEIVRGENSVCKVRYEEN